MGWDGACLGGCFLATKLTAAFITSPAGEAREEGHDQDSRFLGATDLRFHLACNWLAYAVSREAAAAHFVWSWRRRFFLV